MRCGSTAYTVRSHHLKHSKLSRAILRDTTETLTKRRGIINQSSSFIVRTQMAVLRYREYILTQDSSPRFDQWVKLIDQNIYDIQTTQNKVSHLARLPIEMLRCSDMGLGLKEIILSKLQPACMKKPARSKSIAPGTICFYCPEPAMTKDHIIPRSIKRTTEWVPACLLCNTTRGNLPQQDFIQFMEFVKTNGFIFSGMTKRNRRALKVMFHRNTGIKIGLTEL